MNCPTRNTLFGAVLCLVLAAICSSKAKAQGRAIYGAGTVSCAEWQKYRLSDDKPNMYQLQAWTDGFLSGYNLASEDIDVLASRPSTVAFYAWIDNFCGAHPLDSLVVAVSALRKELSDRAKK